MTKYLALAVSAVLVAIDQIIKLWAIAVLEPQHQIPVISGLFYLTYVENRGAAFGILQNQTIFLSIISLLVLLAAIFAILSGKIKSMFLLWSVALVLAGGAGNCIDRISRRFVVDYLDFSALFGFPVFNFADCCVVAGTAMILIYVLVSEQKDSAKRNISPNPPQNREAQ